MFLHNFFWIFVAFRINSIPFAITTKQCVHSLVLKLYERYISIGITHKTTLNVFYVSLRSYLSHKWIYPLQGYTNKKQNDRGRGCAYTEVERNNFWTQTAKRPHIICKASRTVHPLVCSFSCVSWYFYDLWLNYVYKN